MEVAAFVAALVVLVIAGPLLKLAGLRLVRSDELGNVIDAETDPNAPGFEALVESTPTLLLQQLDQTGALTGATLLSLRPGGAGGHVVFIPSGLLVEVPLTTAGQISLVQARADYGSETLEQRLENLLEAGIDLSVDVPPEQWAAVVEPAGTLTVDNPVALALTAGRDDRRHVPPPARCSSSRRRWPPTSRVTPRTRRTSCGSSVTRPSGRPGSRRWRCRAARPFLARRNRGWVVSCGGSPRERPTTERSRSTRSRSPESR